MDRTKLWVRLRSELIKGSNHFKSLSPPGWELPRTNQPVIAAGGMTDFGRAAHNIDATGVATLAARAHEGMAAAASTGLRAPTEQSV